MQNTMWSPICILLDWTYQHNDLTKEWTTSNTVTLYEPQLLQLPVYHNKGYHTVGFQNKIHLFFFLMTLEANTCWELSSTPVKKITVEHLHDTGHTRRRAYLCREQYEKPAVQTMVSFYVPLICKSWLSRRSSIKISLTSLLTVMTEM